MNNDQNPNVNNPNPYPQQPYQQDPNSANPWPYPGMQPPAPKKKHTARNIGLGCLGLVIVLALCGIVMMVASPKTSTATTTTQTTSDTSSTTPQATSKPLAWTTVKTFKGNGSLKTDTFTAPDTWKLSWTCTPSSFEGNSYNVAAMVENGSGGYVDSGVNAMCSSKNTSGSTMVTSGGTVLLDIISEGDWTFTIQEQK